MEPESLRHLNRPRPSDYGFTQVSVPLAQFVRFRGRNWSDGLKVGVYAGAFVAFSLDCERPFRLL